MILRTLVTTLAERGKVVIYSSHLLDVVERVCKEVVILHDSAVVASNSVARIRELTQAASLEDAFAAVAIDQDVARIGREIADVSTL